MEKKNLTFKEELEVRKKQSQEQKIATEKNVREKREKINAEEHIKAEIAEVKEIVENNKNKIVKWKTNKLRTYEEIMGKPQPFKRQSKEDYELLKNSISLNGLHEAIIIRLIKDTDEAMIIAGENRWNAHKDLKIEEIDSRVVDVDDDKVELIMVETNTVQRGNLSAMERARAYQIQKNIYSKKKYGGDESIALNSILDENNTGKTNFYRILSLNNLITEFQAILEDRNRKFSIKVAEQISYLKQKEQIILFNLIESKKIKVNEDKIKNLKKLSTSKEYDLTEDEIIDTFKKKLTPNTKISISFNQEEIEKYFSSNHDKEDIKSIVIEALERTYKLRS